MKKIILFMAYYGKLPDYFDLWLESVKLNNTIDFCIISDLVEGRSLPNNVILKQLSFPEFKETIQNKFEFKISLDNYGRISQFRPAFGYIFEELIAGYDFWGFVECDLILGNIRNFLTDSILEDYDRIFKLGHLQMFKNNKEMNQLFKQRAKSAIDYKFAFTHDILFFEENMGMYNLSNALGYKTYTEPVYADIKWTVLPFIKLTEKNGELIESSKCLFSFENGRLVGYFNDVDGIKECEFIYAHFQKRNMKVCTKSLDKYTIIPNEFVDYCTIDAELFEKVNGNIRHKENEYEAEKMQRVKMDKVKRYKKLDWWKLLLYRKKIEHYGGVGL